jgi:hypothetical protein
MSYETKNGEHYFHELCFYTLGHARQDYFIHQHVVDAWQVQTANPDSKPISVVFGLVGLYLFLEKGFTGRQVQLAHMQLVSNKTAMPPITLPDDRGAITVRDVLQAAEGPDRDTWIKNWCLSVWKAFGDSHVAIADYLEKHLL